MGVLEATLVAVAKGVLSEADLEEVQEADKAVV